MFARKTFVVLWTLFLLANVAHANLVTNGSFEGGTHTGGVFTGGVLTLFAPDTSINGWTITGGSVDWIHTNAWQAADASYSLDMSGLSAGTLTSAPFATVVGQSYQLTFDMAGNFANQVLDNSHSKGMSVDVGGSSQNFFFATPYPDSAASDPVTLMYPDMHWLTQSMLFTATSSLTTLVFTSFENNAYGAALDNVSVVAVSAVPEPVSMAMVVLGLAGLGFARRRAA